MLGQNSVAYNRRLHLRSHPHGFLLVGLVASLAKKKHILWLIALMLKFSALFVLDLHVSDDWHRYNNDVWLLYDKQMNHMILMTYCVCEMPVIAITYFPLVIKVGTALLFLLPSQKDIGYDLNRRPMLAARSNTRAINYVLRKGRTYIGCCNDKWHFYIVHIFLAIFFSILCKLIKDLDVVPYPSFSKIWPSIEHWHMFSIHYLVCDMRDLILKKYRCK